MAWQYEVSNVTLLKLCSFLFWCWSYFYCVHEAPDHSPEWYSRAVTLLHGSVATIAGLRQCGLTTLTECKLTTQLSVFNYALILWSWGYFAFDTFWCVLYWPHNYVILWHHTMAWIAVNVYMGKEDAGCTFACTLALMEVTNPLLQTRWFLRDNGYGHTIIYRLVEVTYLVLFLLIRGVLCTYVIYKILRSDIFDMDEKLVSVSLYIVSLVFIYEIFGYVAYKYKHRLEHFRGFANEVAIILNNTI